jgi:hypothetical protein
VLSNIRRLVLKTCSIAVKLEACDHCILLGLIIRDWSVWGSRTRRWERNPEFHSRRNFCWRYEAYIEAVFGDTDTWMLHKNAGLFKKVEVQEFSNNWMSFPKIIFILFQIQIHQQLNIRLSYHDMRMFIQMLNSLPKQTLWAKRHGSDYDQQPVNVQSKQTCV